MKTFTPSWENGVNNNSAFTLLELLVVVAIIAVLSSLGYAGTRVALLSAAKTREIGAAKSLISAYSAYATENDGYLLPANDATIGVIELPNGDGVSGPAAQRYPFRLAPYFDYKFNGTILVNRNASQVDADNHYLVSLYPALGMNHQFVGGSRTNSGQGGSKEILTSMSQAGSSLIVFISASNGDVGAGKIDGYCNVEPPKLSSNNWKSAKWTSESSSKDYGHVDARYNGKAVCAFLDGAVNVFGIEELRDMRLWSNQAALQNDPNYTVKISSSGGGRR